MLWLYYALLTMDSMVLTINVFSCFTECIYLIIYLVYAPKKAKVFTLKIIFFLNVGLCGTSVLFTLLFLKGSRRLHITGVLCASLAVGVFIAPLSIIRQVIRTRSVEYMPFPLSFFLTLSAVAWFGYGLLIRDIFVAVPNVVGFFFGMVQIILYFIYANAKKAEPVSELTDLEKDPKSTITLNPNVEEINKSDITEIYIEGSGSPISQDEKREE
ncbi:bidirectional sugar transporter SWEET12-like [Typha latifolia]|uniref:bidirectional sugar transporter SWEET12-like n=1 Tax=Typha latifolia TaxID=4733 RepID=UPI003C2F16BD